MSKVNTELLDKCVDWATAEACKGENSLWDQSQWVTDTACGTSYCIAGYVVSLFPERFTLVAPHDRWEHYIVQTKTGKRIAFSDAAAELLGITPAQAAFLFWASNSLQNEIVIMVVMEIIIWNSSGMINLCIS